MDVTCFEDLQALRVRDLCRILPRGRRSLLDVGARDGKIALLAAEFFRYVVALDLAPPQERYPSVVPIVADAMRLPFADGAFDCVLCTEVLEHLPKPEAACAEIARVARHEVVIGVPYRQDLRLGRTICAACGRRNPAWGHLHRFDREDLLRLFRGWSLKELSLVGSTRESTNSLSAFLMDLAGNPWGTYGQKEPCLYCGAPLLAAPAQSVWQKAAAAVSAKLERMQRWFTPTRPIWMHAVFSRPSRADLSRSNS